MLVYGLRQTLAHVFRQMPPVWLPRLFVEAGLAAVLASQLWRQLYMGANLAELPDKVSEAS